MILIVTGAWGCQGRESDEMGGVGKVYGGLFVPLALPDFRTNIKNGHEERIKDHEQTEKWIERCKEEKKARAEMQVGRMIADADWLSTNISSSSHVTTPFVYACFAFFDVQKDNVLAML